MKNTQDPYLARQLSVFFPRGVTPTSKFVCVLPFPDGDARRHRDLSWFGQEKALRPAGGESLYYLAPKCLYRGEYKRGMKCGALLRMSVVLCRDPSVLFLSPSFYSSKEGPRVHV
jgi:hypothetical protein